MLALFVAVKLVMESMTDLERLRGFANAVIDGFPVTHDLAHQWSLIKDRGKAPALTGENDKKISRSAAANSLYWAWLTDCERTTVNEFAGNDVEWWHKNFKHRYLCPIFIRDDPGYSEMITVLHDIKDIDGYNELKDGIINLTSTTKCSVGQFSEYLGKIERFCHERGIELRTDSNLYAQAMGGDYDI